MRTNFFSHFMWMVLLCFAEIFANGDIKTIQLLDNSTKAAIDGAIFRYNTEYGVSDFQGNLELQYTAKDTLYLSHISYGDWRLTPNQLAKAISSGTIYKDQEIFNLQPVTVIALRPKSATAEHLSLNVQDKLSHDAGSVLNQNPIVNSIRKSGSYGFDPVLRGFKYDQLNIVIDGAQSAVAACPNRMDPPTSQIAPNMMDRVEIFKGPHSFRYGTSFGGTINFESNPIRYSNKQAFYGRLSGSSESNGGIYRSEGVVGISAEKYNLGFFGSWSKGSDYKDGDGVSYASGFQRVSFGANLGIHLTYNHQLIFSVTRNIADKTDFPALPMDLISDKTSLFNVQHKMILQGRYLKSWNTTAYTTLVDHLMDNSGKELNPRMMNAKTNAKTYSKGGRTEASWLFINNILYAGLDFKIEKAEGKRTREFLMSSHPGVMVFDNVWNGGQVSKAGIFGEYHHQFSALKVVASGRLEYNQAKATDLNDTFKSKNPKTAINQFNPNFSIGGLKDFDNNYSIGLWYGYAQRSASLTERYINSFPVGLDPYDMLGNPELEPEVNNQVDLILTYKTQNTTIDVNVFTSFLQDFISSEIDTSLFPVVPPSPGVRRYKNITNAFLAGFEVSWQQRLATGLKHHMNIAYTYGKDNILNEPLPEIAPLDFRYTVSGEFLNNKLRPMVTYRYVLKQDRISKIFGETTTPAFSFVDMGLAYQVLDKMTVKVGVKNLLNETYYEHLNRSVRGTTGAIYSPGRNIYFTIALDMM